METKMKQYLRGRWLDLAYWVVITPFFTGLLTRLSTLGAMAILASVVARPTLSLDLWLELPLALVLADLVGYWSHRMRHRGVLWYFHAVHHSPTKLDALAAARMHPVDDIIDNTLVGLTLFLAGFSPETIFAIGPILFLHIALIHADLDWDFGRLGKVFVSPVHHRAHHEVGDEKNFAGMFTFFDTVFGTNAPPSGRGHGAGEEIPETLFGHLAWPMQKLLAKSSSAGYAPENSRSARQQ
jgi:sterol desaturase/sphingolipid hydroxylase (fatty acid hydroxylase superfamily)